MIARDEYTMVAGWTEDRATLGSDLSAVPVPGWLESGDSRSPALRDILARKRKIPEVWRRSLHEESAHYLLGEAKKTSAGVR